MTMLSFAKTLLSKELISNLLRPYKLESRRPQNREVPAEIAEAYFGPVAAGAGSADGIDPGEQRPIAGVLGQTGRWVSWERAGERTGDQGGYRRFGRPS
jgi:hypothetical protein